MKYVDEFRDPELAKKLLKEIEGRSTRPVRLIEFCGGHTHAIMRYGLRGLLPATVELRSGPGCPVCVTANADLDRAIALVTPAAGGVPGLILATFGDMIRVPGSSRTLQDAKAGGADVRVVYSALDVLQMARQNPDRPVVFLGVGFETTAPTIAAAILQAQAEGLENFSVLSLHKQTPPATRAILDAGQVALDGIIGPGHVTTIIGADAWDFLPDEYGVPVAVAGFEPLDILRAVADGTRPGGLVLDAYLLRAMGVAGWAPALTECARCAAPGPHRAFHIGAGGSVCTHCRPSGSVTPPQAVMDLMSALYEGDWPAAESATPAHRSHASGLVAAHLQWHLERQLRTLPLVERVASPPVRDTAAVRQDVPHGDGPGGQLLAGG